MYIYACNNNYYLMYLENFPAIFYGRNLMTIILYKMCTLYTHSFDIRNKYAF